MTCSATVKEVHNHSGWHAKTALRDKRITGAVGHDFRLHSTAEPQHSFLQATTQPVPNAVQGTTQLAFKDVTLCIPEVVMALGLHAGSAQVSTGTSAQGLFVNRGRNVAAGQTSAPMQQLLKCCFGC